MPTLEESVVNEVLLRNLCHGLVGEERQAKMAYYLANPEKVDRDIGRKLHSTRRRKKNPLKKRNICFMIRVTYEQYQQIKAKAKAEGMTMADFCRVGMGLSPSYYKPKKVV
jgi:hypothetical protein